MSNCTTVSIGQLRLKRTTFQDPRIVRVYMDEDMYRKLNLNAQYEQVTPDEYIRKLMSKDLGNSAL